MTDDKIALSTLLEKSSDASFLRVAAFVRRWKADRQREQQTSGRGTFVPLVFAAGEAFQFDWSEDWAELTKVPAIRRIVGKSAEGVIAGERTKLQVAHTKLSHSRAYDHLGSHLRYYARTLRSRFRESGNTA
jgi:hypothetical protein